VNAFSVVVRERLRVGIRADLTKPGIRDHVNRPS
jgi:hypothetical protein